VSCLGFEGDLNPLRIESEAASPLLCASRLPYGLDNDTARAQLNDGPSPFQRPSVPFLGYVLKGERLGQEGSFAGDGYLPL
jgi:hypothetical protein